MRTHVGRSLASTTLARTLCAAAGLSLSVWGCAAKPKPADAAPDGARASDGLTPNGPATPKYESLRSLAQRQVRSPDQRAMELTSVPGVDVTALAPLGDDAPANTREPLEAALAAIGVDAAPAAPTTPESSDASANPQALRLYISGRGKLLEGQAAKAVTDLEAAARLDPNSPQVWRELGSAQLDLGRRTSAMASFQKAHRLGLNEPRVTILVAREDLRAKRFTEAARKLIAARAAVRANDDAGASQLVDVDLSDALNGLGYLAASRDVLAAGLKTRVESIASSPLRNELAEVLRRRADLWARVGDISCRLGEYDKAAEAYAYAAEASTLDPQSVIAKQVYAALRQGRSAQAALVVVEDIRKSEGRVEDRHMAVISHLAQNTDAGPRLAEAISEVARSVGSSATPTVLNRLARATAAALTGDAARAALRTRIAQSPFDADLTTEVLSSYAKDDVRGRAKECLTLITATPISADLCAGVLLNRGQGIDATVTMLEADRAPAARLLYAALVSRLGRPDLALERLEAADFPAAFQAGSLSLEASTAAACGQWDKAAAAEQRLAALKSPAAIDAHVLTLKMLQQFSRGLEEVSSLVTAAGDNASVEQLLIASELAMRCDQPAKAEEFLLRALQRDRFDERVYEPLISLYLDQGPLKDEAKLTGIARQLRQNIPSSRVIRGINAQELVSRSLWAQAEPQLLSLLTEYSENGSVMNMLVTVWERAAKAAPELTAHGEQWLTEKVNARPESSLLVTSLARVLAAQEKGSEAEALLASRLTKWPMPEVARMREWIMREVLEKPVEADRLAAERIMAAPPSIDNSIEKAELLVQKGDVDEGTATLVAGVPTSVQLTKDQSARLAAVILKIDPKTLASGDPKSVESALHLLDLIAGRVPMGDQLHRVRLALLTAAHYDNPPRLIEAAEALAKDVPGRPLDGYAIVITELAKRPDVGPAARFAGAAANHVKPPLAALYIEWMNLVGYRGTPADIDHFAANLKDPEGIALILQDLQQRSGGNIAIPEELDEQRAEVLYQLGSLAPSEGREAAAEHAYRLCLAIKPDHPWASNNLGYEFLERGVNMEEAERLIRHAYSELSDEASVVDSMGWLLYKLGIIEDTVDADGNVTQVGAISLLAQAVADVPQNPTLAEHFGDALWRGGTPDQKEQAKLQWQQSEATLELMLTRLTGDDPLVKLMKPATDRSLARVREKLKAAREGREPMLSPLAPGGGDAAR